MKKLHTRGCKDELLRTGTGFKNFKCCYISAQTP